MSNRRIPSPLTYLRVSVTKACNLRCCYCMPYRATRGETAPVLAPSEIASLVDAFARNGVTKVRLTGGEPLTRADLPVIARLVARTPGIETFGLTTNGTQFAELARTLAEAGVQMINISLDSLQPEVSRRITGTDALERTLQGIEAAVRCGFRSVKTNTVVMRGINDSEVDTIARFACERGIEPRFIELMPLGRSSDEWRTLYVPAAEIRRALGLTKPLPVTNHSSVRRYKRVDGSGTVGIISPMSESFCGECNRIRLTASGKLKPCLRLPLEEDLRALTHDLDLALRLGEFLRRLGHRKLAGGEAMSSAIRAQAMSYIGG